VFYWTAATGSSLTSVFQAKAFLQAFHQSRLTGSSKLVEDELWNPADVSPNIQRLTDALVDAAMRDPPELALPNGPSASASSSPPPILSSPSAPSNAPSSGFAKHLRIEDRSYFAVNATLQTLNLLADYERLVRALPTLTTDAMSRTVEFLKAFNSRTCQVVLGAGAMRSAGLKNITAKHLGELTFFAVGLLSPVLRSSESVFRCSACVTVPCHHDYARALRTGDVPAPPESETGSHAS
jgi:vacuolar protein sorting-associated protein 54